MSSTCLECRSVNDVPGSSTVVNACCALTLLSSIHPIRSNGVDATREVSRFVPRPLPNYNKLIDRNNKILSNSVNFVFVCVFRISK